MDTVLQTPECCRLNLNLNPVRLSLYTRLFPFSNPPFVCFEARPKVLHLLHLRLPPLLLCLLISAIVSPGLNTSGLAWIWTCLITWHQCWSMRNWKIDRLKSVKSIHCHCNQFCIPDMKLMWAELCQRWQRTPTYQHQPRVQLTPHQRWGEKVAVIVKHWALTCHVYAMLELRE